MNSIIYMYDFYIINLFRDFLLVMLNSRKFIFVCKSFRENSRVLNIIIFLRDNSMSSKMNIYMIYLSLKFSIKTHGKDNNYLPMIINNYYTNLNLFGEHKINV